MKLTQHAKKRCQQRGFSKQIINLILTQGRNRPAPGGAMKIFFGRREYQEIISELKQAIQVMDKAKNGILIINDNRILTAYKYT